MDVQSSSVGAAYIVPEGESHAICYAARMSIDAHEGEPAESALKRTLDVVLAADGGPLVATLGQSLGHDPRF